MRWKDPISGKFKKVTLDLERYPNDAARVKAAYRKSIEIQAMRLDKREGVTSMPVRNAFNRFVAEHRRTLRARTIADYERIGEIFVGWCERNEIKFTRELTRARLAAFRTERVTLPSSRDDGLRSPVSVNVELRAVQSAVRRLVALLTEEAEAFYVRGCPRPDLDRTPLILREGDFRLGRLEVLTDQIRALRTFGKQIRHTTYGTVRSSKERLGGPRWCMPDSPAPPFADRKANPMSGSACELRLKKRRQTRPFGAAATRKRP